MKYLKSYPKLLESFQKSDFMDIIKDKLLELSDMGFNAYIEDSNNEPLLEKMVRITINKSHRSEKSFKFSECSYVISDILLTNIRMSLYKIQHVIVMPAFRGDSGPSHSQGERLSWLFVNGEEGYSYDRRLLEATWSYENSRLKAFDPLNLDVRGIEIFFE
jgi:hypothetical protein